MTDVLRADWELCMSKNLNMLRNRLLNFIDENGVDEIYSKSFVIPKEKLIKLQMSRMNMIKTNLEEEYVEKLNRFLNSRGY